MLRRMTLISLLAITLAIAITPAASAAGLRITGEPRIAMLYFGAKNDGGWTQALDEARVKIEAALGTKVQFAESIGEDAAATKPAAERFIARGANIVIGTAFGQSDALRELASKYPGVAFLNAAGTTNNGQNL